MLTLSSLQALQADPSILAGLQGESLSPQHTLSLLTRLRKQYAPDVASAALETAQLRQKAITKFSLAKEMFFTDSALQQSTGEEVASYHAALLTGYPMVADLGCGIGGDAVMMGQQTHVIGLDLDPLRLAMARHNAHLYRAKADFLQADLANPLPLRNIPAFFFDPARRTQERRLFSVKGYHPPLEIIQRWGFAGGLVKISPGVQLEELSGFHAGISFVSMDGDLKECLLQVGDLAFSGYQAVMLPEKQMLQSQGLEAPPLSPTPLTHLYEPDAALIRSGLFGELAAAVGATLYRIDETIAYLTSNDWIDSPWVRVWRIDGWMPFNLKKLKAELVKQGVGKVTVKKRGSPLSPEELERLLGLKKGDREAILFLTRLAGQPIVLWSL